MTIEKAIETIRLTELIRKKVLEGQLHILESVREGWEINHAIDDLRSQLKKKDF